MNNDCTDCTITSKVASVDKTSCITASACTDMAGHVNMSGNCINCIDSSKVASVDEISCIAASTCTATASQVATASGDCEVCEGQTPVRSITLDECFAMCPNAQLVRSGSDTCEMAMTCSGGEVLVPTTNTCETPVSCTGIQIRQQATNTCVDDQDMDQIVDADDQCPNGVTGLATTSDQTAPTADPDNDGCKNSEDVDDDNDGLIEIATAGQLNNMRYDLAGKSYDDEADDGTGNEGDTTGAPTIATTLCKTATRGVYLCGYELVADIDFSGDGDITTTANNIDLNSTTAGNFNPIGNPGNFTAHFEGNGHTISHLNIDTTGATSADDDANDASLIVSCNGVVNALTLNSAIITGRRNIGVLCAKMTDGTARNVRIAGGSVTHDGAVLFVANVGGLVGQMSGSSISNSYATSDVSPSSTSSFLLSSFGGLVGQMTSTSINNSIISNSYATGDVSAGDNAGGLVGIAFGNISNSYATGDVSAASNASDAGGLVGLMSGSISNSYATGDVSAGDETGGLVGRMGGSISNSYATGDVSADGDGGGLLGLLSGSMNNSYATGDISTDEDAGGLVGRMSRDSSISNSYATGDVSAASNAGGLVGETAGNNIISSSYFNSEASQIVSGTDRAAAAKRGVGSDASASGVSSQTLSQIQSLTASTLSWDATNHWSGVGTAGSFPFLRYGDNSATSSVDECELLPGHGNSDAQKPRCTDLLPDQELYRARVNLVFSNVAIGAYSSSDPEFFYQVDGTSGNDSSITVTYNLVTGVTLSASGVEQADGTASTDVTWSQGSTAGTIGGIAEGETFWLSLTFQKGSVMHKVRTKFVRPSP